MGQSKWVGGCALVALTIAHNAIAQQAGEPFAKSVSSASAASSELKTIPETSLDVCNARDRAEQRIKGVLNQPLREPLDFVEQPLREVMLILSETYDVPIQFDTAALDAVAASPDVKVTIQIHNVTVRSALDLMLRNAGAEELTYIIDNEVLLVTTQEESEMRLEVIVYRVDDLLSGANIVWQSDADFDRLIDVIISSVEHESWMENRTGEGEIKAFPPGMIVVSQTHRVHEQLQTFLDELRCNKAKIEATTAEARADAATRPISRSIAINGQSVGAEDTQRSIREALMKSVDWIPADAEIADKDKFLLVLSDRVLVRHLPHVVAQVEHSVKELKLEPPRLGGSLCGSDERSERKPDLAEEPKPSEDSGKQSRGAGLF